MGVSITSRALYSIWINLYSIWITSVTGKQTLSWYEVSTVLEMYVYGSEDYQQILVQCLDHLCDRETDRMCMGVRITSRALYSIWITSVTGKQTLSWYWSKFCTGDMCMGVRITSRSLYNIWITSMRGKETSSWYWSKYCIGDVCVWEWGLPAYPCTVSGPPLWQGNSPWVDIEVSTVLEMYVYGNEDYQQVLVQYLDHLCNRETDLELILT